MFVTFYSYKGGVGRSLALANVACLMAGHHEHPQRVLLWDFDLEAPGLHRLFPTKQPQRYGFVDLVYEYATTGNIPEIQDYIYESDVPGIYILPAGRMSESYCDKLQRINWVQFFGSDPKEPGPFFRNLLKSIKLTDNPFDYVLIDSRTGLNDQAGICTQVLSDLLIVLFRLTSQNLDGLEHLIPAIRSQLKKRGKENTEILPIASQVRATGSEEQSLIRKKAVKIFEKELEYIRFDEDLVNQERLFCLFDNIETMWPCPPIVDDYKRICGSIRQLNKDDTKTLARELHLRMHESDTATASTLLLRLLPRRPRLHQAWRTLSDIFDYGMPASRKQQFNKTVSRIVREDPENFFAYQWKASFQSSNANSPESSDLRKAKNSLNKAIMCAPESEKGNIYRALASIESVQGNNENAIKVLRKAQALMPKNNQVNLDLAILHVRMGAKYFAVAAEELDEISPDVGIEKYILLAYVRTFLGELKKAKDAFAACDKSMKPLAKAHMLLIERKTKEALELADKRSLSGEDPLGLANWAEFYFCAGQFEKSISLAETTVKSAYDSPSDLKSIKKLARLLKKKRANQKEIDSLIALWSQSSWNFRELLMFRECSIRDGKNFGNLLDVIERLIQFQKLNEITTQGVGLFKKSIPI